ncbi:hypothetical protein FHS27_003554 [Rhodopirellula rubra]|uniref:Uncharacterized protein n=1 Tax=Aporhodopirellula rubra TaxID=980271 RepID=A0A7W5H5P9_9BACT|nr:hypothetical protein [Aporhodopirellula rubra]MBB3207727.1 hypothetical protein [Aporhodopirellula rubra]
MSRIVAPSNVASSTGAAIDIESIVRRVLSELKVMGNQDAAAKPTGPLVITKRVIALTDVEAIATTVKQIELPSRAVVTPAARDELRHRGITITKTNTNTDQTATATPTTTPAVQPGTRAIDLQTDGDVSATMLSSVKKQLTLRGIRLCNRASVTVILSSRPATTAHHSCGGDRCVVSINRLDDVRRFLAELSPNVFVLDVMHLHLVAITGAITTIAKPSIATQSRPQITVAGGLS